MARGRGSLETLDETQMTHARTNHRKLREADAILALTGSRKSLDNQPYGIVNGNRKNDGLSKKCVHRVTLSYQIIIGAPDQRQPTAPHWMLSSVAPTTAHSIP